MATMDCVWCCVSISEEPLYQCTFSGCPHSKKILCEKCAERVHHKISSHTFKANKMVLKNIKNPEKLTQKTKQKYPTNVFKHNESQKVNVGISAHDIIASSHPIGAVGSSLYQIANVSYKYNNNEILDENGNKDEQEYKRLVKRSVFVPAVSSVSMCVAALALSVSSVSTSSVSMSGAALALSVSSVSTSSVSSVSMSGAALALSLSSVSTSSVSMSGTALACKLIAITGLGHVGLIIAISYGILGGILSRKMFDKYLPESSQKRKELKFMALRSFGFFEEDLENENVFNQRVIEKRYKKLAKIYHPDRASGDESKFQELEFYHRIVLLMLNDDSVFPMVQFDINGVPYIDQSTQQRKAICCDKSAAEVAKSAKRGWFEW